MSSSLDRLHEYPAVAALGGRFLECSDVTLEQDPPDVDLALRGLGSLEPPRARRLVLEVVGDGSPPVPPGALNLTDHETVRVLVNRGPYLDPNVVECDGFPIALEPVGLFDLRGSKAIDPEWMKHAERLGFPFPDGGRVFVWRVVFHVVGEVLVGLGREPA